MNNYLYFLNKFNFNKISLFFQINVKKINWHKVSILPNLSLKFREKYNIYFPDIIPTSINLINLYLKNNSDKIDILNLNPMNDEIFKLIINNNMHFINFLIPLFKKNKISESLFYDLYPLYSGPYYQLTFPFLSEKFLLRYFDDIHSDVFLTNENITHKVFTKWENFIISRSDILHNISKNIKCFHVIPEKYLLDIDIRKIINICYFIEFNILSKKLKNILFEQPHTFNFNSKINNYSINFTFYANLYFFDDEILINWYYKLSIVDWNFLIEFYPFSKKIIENNIIKQILSNKIDLLTLNNNIDDILLIHFDEIINWDNFIIKRKNISNKLLTYLITNNKIMLSVLLNYFNKN